MQRSGFSGSALFVRLDALIAGAYEPRVGLCPSYLKKTRQWRTGPADDAHRTSRVFNDSTYL